MSVSDQDLLIRQINYQQDQTEPSADAQQIVDIYNHYIKHSPATFDTEPFTVHSRLSWFNQFDGEKYICLVAVQDDQIIGYANSAKFKPKPAYGTSVEVSVYLHPDFTGQGGGKHLYRALFEHLGNQPIHRCYAGVTLPNPASIALHQGFGFQEVGHFHEVGYKFSRYWDVAWLERAA